jgi:hypothetical protein
MDVPFSELTFLLAQTPNFAYTHAKTDVECLENQILYYLQGRQQEPLRARQDRQVLFRNIKVSSYWSLNDGAPDLSSAS